MKEFIYSRNAVYETLRAGRRQAYRLLIGEGVKEKGRINEILSLANTRQIQVQRVPRSKLDSIHRQHQGVALQTSGYPYQGLLDIFSLANIKGI